MTVPPPDKVRRGAAFSVDLYDHSLAIRVTDMASPDHQFIADYPMHHFPPFHMTKLAADASLGAGPKVQTPGPSSR